MHKYLLSIVIPTRNRQYYCKSAVEQILSLNLKSTQIVVQDNSDDDSLCYALQDYIKYNSVKYNRHDGIISFVDNFSEAISLCDGEYVCMIGDDDGILPNIEIVTESAKNNDIDCIVAGLNVVYLWPSPKSIVKNGENGYLCISYIKNKEEFINPERGLHKLAQLAGQGYQDLELPRVYHGIAKRQKFEEIKNKVGNYFKGLTPDIFIAVALAIVCDKVKRIYYPVTISGICPGSGSSNSATGKHTGELKDAPHFIGHDNYKWEQLVPEIYSVETIWAETTLQAFRLFSRNDLIEEFNVKYLDTLCINKYPQFENVIKQHASKYNVELGGNGYFKYARILNLLRRIKQRISHKPNSVHKYYNVNDLNQVTNILASHLVIPSQD